MLMPTKQTTVKDCTDFWSTSMKHITTQEICGLTTKKFEIIETYGTGAIVSYSFDGLHIGVRDITFAKDLQLHGVRKKEVLELSFLIEGEQIIHLHNHKKKLIYESPECYLTYINKTTGTVSFHKNKRFKEIKISMNQDFIKKYRLLETYEMNKNDTQVSSSEYCFQPLCSKTQQLLTELLSDTHEGLLKRLFLESKVLELLALQLDTSKNNSPKATSNDHKISKKLFEIQKLINSDLTTQFSIQELARKVGLNDFIAKKEFKRIFGETIFEFALKQRISKAKQLLAHTQKPIYEISELVGYKNATHFSAAFKKVTSQTPKKYRNTLPDRE